MQAVRNPPLANKIERVCSALREAMTQTPEDREHYQQPILSSLVREGRVGEAISMAETEQALNYLSLLMDTDRLYEEALSVYNLDKALKIAGKYPLTLRVMGTNVLLSRIIISYLITDWSEVKDMPEFHLANS